MRKLVVTENITLDGVIDASGGWFAPGDDTADLAEVAAVLRQQSAESDALLLGRTSFEEMRAFWPFIKPTTPPASPHTLTRFRNSSSPPP